MNRILSVVSNVTAEKIYVRVIARACLKMLLPFCKRIHRHLVLEIFSGCRLDMGEGSAGTFINKVNAREEINVTIDITTKMVYSHCKQKHYNKMASEFP